MMGLKKKKPLSYDGSTFDGPLHRSYHGDHGDISIFYYHYLATTIRSMAHQMERIGLLLWWDLPRPTCIIRAMAVHLILRQGQALRLYSTPSLLKTPVFFPNKDPETSKLSLLFMQVVPGQRTHPAVNIFALIDFGVETRYSSHSRLILIN